MGEKFSPTSKIMDSAQPQPKTQPETGVPSKTLINLRISNSDKTQNITELKIQSQKFFKIVPMYCQTQKPNPNL